MVDIKDRDARIRARAYEIWDRNGRQEGTHREDWLQAASEIDSEIGEDASQIHPVMSGGIDASETALPDPFASRRTSAGNSDQQTLRPTPIRISKTPKSL